MAWPFAGRLRLVVSYASPAMLVAVGYIDPGNWGTDIAAGTSYRYRLLWVLVAAGAVAIFLQYLAAKLGVATGSDLAAVCGERLRPFARRVLAILVIIALVATDLAEFLGVVIALRILVGGPVALDIGGGLAIVFGVLALGRSNRALERWIVGLVSVVAIVYLVAMWRAAPGPGALIGLVPAVPVGSLPTVVGIVGATVMPHNLFLHSGVVHWRGADGQGSRARLQRVTAGCVAALAVALLLNVAILVVTAATARSGTPPATLEASAAALTPVLGRFTRLAFGLGLLAAGIAATITSGVAGDFALVGLTPVRISTLGRRALAVVPASVAIACGMGEVTALLLSQVMLGLLLPAVAAVLIWLTSDARVMTGLVNRHLTRRAGYLLCCALGVASVLALIPSGVL